MKNQSKHGAQREQPVRLVHPSVHEVVHEDADVGIVAPQDHGLHTSDPAHGIDPSHDTLAGRLFVSGRSVYLPGEEDRKSTRLNSSHGYISYAVFCLKKKKNN